jgi:Rieske 2Fe-2S family protein
MQHPCLDAVVRAAIACAKADEPPQQGEAGSVPVSVYTDPARLAAERARLFRALPVPIAHTSETGSVLVRELDGVSILVARGADGVLRGFLNSCRHRGVRLVREEKTCPKAFVCPYHGWTYGLDGALRHVPHASSFGDLAGRDLVPVRIEERHGIVWASLDARAPDVATLLGDLDEELGALGLDRHVALRSHVSEQRGNWKMLMEGFLEGYHIRNLHRASVYPFFLDARAVAERVGPHVRAATARRAAREAKDGMPTRDLATPSYTIFPATTLILHPDWTSLVVVQPLATDRFLWSHTQLVAEAPSSDAARAHFERSFTLIQGSVFDAEDLHMCAEAQKGLETGANDTFLFGRLESPALWFHESVRDAL